MAENRAQLDQNGHVLVNGKKVYEATDKARAALMVERLNRIFKDPHRDLDFITPTILAEQGTRQFTYALCCPLVRIGYGLTHFYPGKSRPNPLNRFLYEDTNWQDSDDTTKQSAILEIEGSETPWYEALRIANQIRDAIQLNAGDAASKKRLESNKCYPLHVPSNQQGVPARVISYSAYCAVYGHPCQGRMAGAHSRAKCADFTWPVENISNPFTQYQPKPSQFEILHSQDLTCAMTDYVHSPKNYWYDRYKNQFIRVTNLTTKQSIVVRVTDKAPRNTGVELTYRAWSAIGKPLGPNKVKVELMG